MRLAQGASRKRSKLPTCGRCSSFVTGQLDLTFFSWCFQESQLSKALIKPLGRIHRLPLAATHEQRPHRAAPSTPSALRMHRSGRRSEAGSALGGRGGDIASW